MPTIRLEHIGKIYKSELRRKSFAVLDIDLEIRQGEFVFVVGSVGAGKSTLLDIISGDILPDRGRVYLDDVNLNRLTKRQSARLRYCMGKVPQEPALIRTKTVGENLVPSLHDPADMQDVEDAERMRKALGLVGMPGSEDHYPADFTFSECRRIEIAKAILHSPSILLLDSISNKMDDAALWDVLSLLDELNARGTTIVMSTHAEHYVNVMRKRVVTLSDGKIVGDVSKGKYGII